MSKHEKQCTLCKKILSIDNFRSRGGKLAHLKRSRCNDCLYSIHKEWVDKNEDKVKSYRQKDKWTLKKRCDRYGIEISELFDKYLSQEGKCAICCTYIDLEDSAIDHNHDTGEFRGILCKLCNRGLGMFMDSPSILKSAFEYLNRNGFYGNFEK
jgi:hypothetical protein